MEKRQLKAAIEEWLDISKKRSVKAATFDRLKIAFGLMCKYSISVMPVKDIRSEDLQEYLNTLVDDGYSMSTIKKQFNLITAYWKNAMATGRIKYPIYMAVSLPSETSLKAPKKEVETYSEYEQRKLMRTLSGLSKRQYGAAILMLESGLRVGEVLSLRWEDILWNRRAVKVGRTLVRMSSEKVTYIQESPKSKTSKRTIPLSTTAMDILRKLDDGSCGLIFHRDDSEDPISYSSLEFHIKKACKEAGVPYRGMHAFRHTFATNCYERGCDVKVLSKLLGHSDVSITYNTYIHLFGDALEEMRKVLG